MDTAAFSMLKAQTGMAIGKYLPNIYDVDLVEWQMSIRPSTLRLLLFMMTDKVRSRGGVRCRAHP